MQTRILALLAILNILSKRDTPQTKKQKAWFKKLNNFQK